MNDEYAGGKAAAEGSKEERKATPATGNKL